MERTFLRFFFLKLGNQPTAVQLRNSLYFSTILVKAKVGALCAVATAQRAMIMLPWQRQNGSCIVNREKPIIEYRFEFEYMLRKNDGGCSKDLGGRKN